MPEITWKIGGVDGTRWRIQRASLWRPPVVVRRTSVEVPGRHGAVQAGKVVFGEPTVSLVFQPLGYDDQGELEAAVNDLTAIVAAPVVELTRVSGGLVTSAAAALVSISHELFVVGTIARVVVVLAIPGVFLREVPVVLPEIKPVSGTTVLAGLEGSTAPVTDMIARVKGPVTSVTMTGSDNGTGLSWTGTLEANKFLYMDAGRLKAHVSTFDDAWTAGGTDVSGGLDYPAAGPLVLQPVLQEAAGPDDPLVRSVKVAVGATGTSGATALTIRAGRAFL